MHSLDGEIDMCVAYRQVRFAKVEISAGGAHWPVVGLALWWEMSSHRTCPLTGNVLWWVFLHFSTLRQEKASGGKNPVVGTKLWWCLPHLFSNASLSFQIVLPKSSACKN